MHKQVNVSLLAGILFAGAIDGAQPLTVIAHNYAGVGAERKAPRILGAAGAEMYVAQTVLALAMCVSGPGSTSQLADDLRSLRREVYAQFVEDQRERVAALEAAVEDARREIARIDSTLQSQREELQSWMKELYESELPAQERAQAQSAKEEAVAATERQLRGSKAAALAREGQLVQRLTRERERLRRFEQVVNAR